MARIVTFIIIPWREQDALAQAGAIRLRGADLVVIPSAEFGSFFLGGVNSRDFSLGPDRLSGGTSGVGWTLNRLVDAGKDGKNLRFPTLCRPLLMSFRQNWRC